MRRLLLAVITIAVSAVAALWIHAPSTRDSEEQSMLSHAEEALRRPRPRLVVEGDLTYDFGRMPTGTRGEREWAVENTGFAPLRLITGYTSNSCTVVVHEKDKLFVPSEDTPLIVAPGDRARICLHWKIGTIARSISEKAEIQTNAPGSAVITFRVKGVSYPASVPEEPDTRPAGVWNKD